MRLLTAAGVVTIADLVSDEVLQPAYAWLCKRRKDYPPASDIWSFRRAWRQEKEKLKHELIEGRFRLGLMSRIQLDELEEEIDLWSLRDALIRHIFMHGSFLPVVSDRITHIHKLSTSVTPSSALPVVFRS